MSPNKKPDRGFSHSDEETSPGRYSLAGRFVHCPHCDGEEFKIGEAQLNTMLATLLKLDWANKSASILICAACGQIQWFEQPPAKVD